MTLVAVPLEEENGLDSKLSEHFGRAPYFAFVEVKGKDVVSWKIEKNTLEHGAVSEYIITRGVDLVLVKHIGPHAREKLVNSGVRIVYVTEDTLSRVLNQHLKALTGEEKL